MDTKDFADWLLTEYEPRPLFPATVNDTLSKLRNLQRCGLDLDAFTAKPGSARKAARKVLALKATMGGHALRDAQVMLNRVIAWKAARNRAWLTVRYSLAPAPKSTRPIQEAGEVAALEGYAKGRDAYENARRVALIWMVRACRLRRGEFSRMEVQHLRPHFSPSFGAILVPLPGKKGRARVIPLPPSAWDPGGPLQRWLKVRRRDPRHPGALWVRRDGLEWQAMTPGGLTVEMNQISKDVGFRVSFNRLRRYAFTRMKRLKVPPWVMLDLHGGSSYRVLEEYLGGLTTDEVHEGLTVLPEFDPLLLPQEHVVLRSQYALGIAGTRPHVG